MSIRLVVIGLVFSFGLTGCNNGNIPSDINVRHELKVEGETRKSIEQTAKVAGSGFDPLGHKGVRGDQQRIAELEKENIELRDRLAQSIPNLAGDWFCDGRTTIEQDGVNLILWNGSGETKATYNTKSHHIEVLEGPAWSAMEAAYFPKVNRIVFWNGSVWSRR